MNIPTIRTPMPIGPCVSLTVDPVDPAFVVLEWRYAGDVLFETLHADDLRTALAAVATPGGQEDREGVPTDDEVRCAATESGVITVDEYDAWFAARQPAVQTVSAEQVIHTEDESGVTRWWRRAAAYASGEWCGECRYGVAEDPPCCTPCPCCGGHSGEHAPRITLAAAAPTVEQVAEAVLPAIRRARWERAYGRDPVIPTDEVIAEAVAEQVAALWGAR